MRNKTRLNIVDIKRHKKLISDIIIDNKTKELLIDKIDYFNRNGSLIRDKNNLFGKVKYDDFFDYLEFIHNNDKAIINYTTWDRRKVVSIIQKKLQNGNIKVVITEKNEIASLQDENSANSIETTKIYNKEGKLLHDTKLKYDDTFNSYPDKLIYDFDKFYHNYIDLEKNWYLKEGVIVNYKVNKVFTSETNSKLIEQYTICDTSISSGGHYYIPLFEDLFKQFMSGEITQEEMIRKNSSNFYEEGEKKK